MSQWLLMYQDSKGNARIHKQWWRQNPQTVRTDINEDLLKCYWSPLCRLCHFLMLTITRPCVLIMVYESGSTLFWVPAVGDISVIEGFFYYYYYYRSVSNAVERSAIKQCRPLAHIAITVKCQAQSQSHLMDFNCIAVTNCLWAKVWHFSDVCMAHWMTSTTQSAKVYQCCKI